MLRNEGWEVNHKRVERIWRQEGLKVPKKQPKRRRLWLTDGSCIRLRPEKKDHVWSYDFVMIRTTDGRAVRILVIIDEYTRECLSLSAAKSFRSQEMLDQLYDLFIGHGTPEYIRSDNGSEFTATAVRKWLSNLEIGTLFIEPGSPWENGYVESFYGKLRDELLNREIFDTLFEDNVLLEHGRWAYNGIQPHFFRAAGRRHHSRISSSILIVMRVFPLGVLITAPLSLLLKSYSLSIELTSLIVMARSSSNTETASAKSIPCFFLLEIAFLPSHSISIPLMHAQLCILSRKSLIRHKTTFSYRINEERIFNGCGNRRDSISYRIYSVKEES